MPKHLEDKIKHQLSTNPKYKNLSEDRKNAILYGILRRTGWVPKREKSSSDNLNDKLYPEQYTNKYSVERRESGDKQNAEPGSAGFNPMNGKNKGIFKEAFFAPRNGGLGSVDDTTKWTDDASKMVSPNDLKVQGQNEVEGRGVKKIDKSIALDTMTTNVGIPIESVDTSSDVSRHKDMTIQRNDLRVTGKVKRGPTSPREGYNMMDPHIPWGFGVNDDTKRAIAEEVTADWHNDPVMASLTDEDWTMVHECLASFYKELGGMNG